MNKKSIKAFMLAALFMGALTITSCNTGTEPGETNTERGDVKEEGSMNQGYTSEDSPGENDTTDMERHYDHADHENHDDNNAGAVHEGTGKKPGVERDDLEKKQ